MSLLLTRVPALAHPARPLARLLAVVALCVTRPVVAQDTHAAVRAVVRPAPVAEIVLEPWRTRWSIRARVGGVSRRLLLDTGAGITLLSPAALQSTGCTPWGRHTGFNMFGKRFDGPHCDGVAVEIAGRSYTAPSVGRVNLAALNPADSLLDGIAGLDLFDGQAVTLDLAHGRLTVESPASLEARVTTMRPLPIRVKREVDGLALAVAAAVPTTQGMLWMELDSGNGGTVLVSKPVAGLVGLDSTAQGPQNADFEVLPGVRVRTGSAFTPDMIMDGNLGMPFLRQWLITLDLRSGRAWIAPADGAS